MEITTDKPTDLDPNAGQGGLESGTPRHISPTAFRGLLFAQKGTVEAVLRILADEEIGVKVISQREDGGTIVRDSVLFGLSSGVNMVEAHSLVDTSALSGEVILMIRSKQMGIGKILEKSRLETYYDIVSVGHEDGLPCRRYKIWHDRKAVFEITEKILV